MATVGRMIDAVTYRLEGSGDHDAVRDVVRRAFDHHPGVEALVDDLRELDAWLGLSYVAVAYVAVADNAVIGHVSFTRGLLDAPARLVDVVVLSPLSVAPQHQRHGVGGRLIRHALEQLQGRPEPLVFLEGSPSYYSRFGFVAGSGLGFRRPSLRIPEAAFQVLPLPAYGPGLTGMLVYHRAFWDHDAVGLRDQPR